MHVEVMLLGYSQELVSQLYVGYIAWNPRIWPWVPRTLKRKFANKSELCVYMNDFERKWYELHKYEHL